MQKIILTALAVTHVLIMGGPLAMSEETAAGDYPYRPVPFTQVHFSDSFWLPRMETNRTATIPFAFRQCEDTSRIENFKIAAKLSDKLWEGDFGFNDSDVYKVIEGASYALMVKPDPKLDTYMDEVISYIAAAQEPDGYLYTAWTAQAKKYRDKINCCYENERWDNIQNAHQLYNLGHMYEAAAAHYQATGRRSFLEVAIKSADHVCETFGPDANPGVPGHQEIEIGLAKLFRATGDAKYLKQAQWFLSQRGRSPGDRDTYRQTHKPVVEQTQAVGHAVRANYMYSGMADVAAMTGDSAFIKAIDAIWDDVAHKKFYVTGGIGARHAGEAYGDAYELPNASAYCETCAAIANVYWNHRMFLLHGQSRYIDLMERSLYNAVLSGVALDGMKFFYPNPLESAAGHQRSPWFGCACCPSNICRFIASVPGYAYAVRGNAAYVNLFVNGTAAFEVGGKEVSLTQVTDYPWNGKVKITVEPKDNEQAFALKIRIPDWTQDKQTSSALYSFADQYREDLSIVVNGVPASKPGIKTRVNADGDVDIKRKWQPSQQFLVFAFNDDLMPPRAIESEDGYVVINKTWKRGDTVHVNFPMPIRRVLSDERVKDNVGKVALMRGPLVYCVEGHDVEGGKALNLLLEKDTELTAEKKLDLLGGVTVVKGTAMELKRTANGGIARTPRAFEAIPYYAWAHRGKTPMAVWLPYDEKGATPLPAPTIATQSKVTTSYLANVGINGLNFINDQAVPRRSADASPGYLHWWPHKGTTEWVQYDFAEATNVSEASVYWFDDTGHGECRVPKSWRLLYRDSGEWKPVANTCSYTCTKNALDTVTFAPVKTDALRLEVTLPEGFSSGVQEWTVR